VPETFPDNPPVSPLDRGRKSIAVDLKSPAAIEVVLRLVGEADALIEGFRPGVMERLGLGPDICLARNPRLVYGRMTGWGQEGPYSQMAGHDINYIALAGCLAHIGADADAPPAVPLNLAGDFGGGGMLLALGVLGGLIEAGRSGQGQVVDAAMVDGAAMLMASFHGANALGGLRPRGQNQLDGASHTAVVKDFQRHAIRGTLTHIDLHEVRLDVAIQATVALNLVGESPGARQGGLVQQVAREVRIEALPTAIPDGIDVSIDELELGEVVRLSDVPVPAGITVLDDPETIVASCMSPRGLTEEEEEEAAAAAAAAEGEEPDGEAGEGDAPSEE